jgi:outer membrane protein OmpA-like peptidoglycan-associated protein
MITVCPQKHADSERLTQHLLALRWQISQLRKATGHSLPLVLNGQVGSAMMNDMLWQVAIPGESVRMWRASSAPCSIAAWITTGGLPAMQQQVLMNSLMSWFHHHVEAVFTDENPDVPAIAPLAMLWGMGPILAGSLATSVWTAWLSHRTAMQQVAGWQPIGSDSTILSPFPDFVLPLLPEGEGLTSRGRSWRCALGIFTLAATAALLSSGWNNRQLLQRVSFDIARYDRIPMQDSGPKASAVATLRDDATELDGWARNGVPARMSLGLYQGERLRMPVLDAIRSYEPPSLPPEPQPIPQPVTKIVRLDSMSLFDSGKAVLKTGSTRMLVNSLVGIKAKPGWLIVVSGHTDNTGNPQLNQTLSLRRAAAVRDWMRDTGDVPESCFAVQGYGESRPVATNDTPAGRALNRRVEISLVPQANACQIPGNTQASSQDDDVSQHNGE